jgi:type II secretory pathway component PulF
MGLVTLASGLQYFSFSEELQLITTKVFAFIFSFSPVWFLMIIGFTLVFIIIGVIYLVGKEVGETAQ